MREPSSTPSGTDPDALWRRWRESGDPSALGALFDATAPELFGVALHLCRDPARAEDALQETFLAALEAPDRHDAERRVVPWLVGILRNKLHEVRRFSARAPDPARVGRPAPAGDPVLDAANAEEEERIRRALAELPEPYREVAMLRWRHGLEPAEIAELKRMAPGTVRSLLHRALERLRRTLVALPSLLFGGRDGAAPRGLDAVRGAVIAGAPGAAVAAGSAVVLGGIVMAKKSLAAAVIAVVVLATAGVGVWSATRPDAAAPPDGPVVGRAGPAAPSSPPTAAPAAAETPPAEPAAPEIPPPVDLSKCDRDLDLFGVVVDSKDTPVPGARLSLFEYPLRRGGILTDGLGYWKERPGPHCLSSTDGSFAFRLRRGHLTHLRATKPGVAEAVLSDCQAGERVRIVLEPPARLVVRARDAGGAAVSGVRVRVSASYKVYFTLFNREGVTDPSGACVFEGLPPGPARLHDIEHATLAVKTRPRVELPAGGEVEVEILLQEGRTVHGTVKDADSEAPIEGARVGTYFLFSRPVFTGKDGAFEYPGWIGGDMANLHAVAPGWGRASMEVPADGTVDFRLHRGDQATGRCLGADGAPVPDTVVCAMGHQRDGGREELDTVTSATDPAGRFHVAGLRRDLPHTLVVMAPGHGRFLLDFVPRSGSSGTIDLGDLRLPAAHRIEGRVLGPGGRPVPDARVRLVGANRDRDRLLPEGHKSLQSFYGNNETRRTDDLGRFRFPDISSGRYELFASVEGHTEIRGAVALAEGKDALGVELGVTATEDAHTLVVLVVDEAGAPLPGIRVEAEQAEGSAMKETGPGGRAELESLKAGRVSVSAWDSGVDRPSRYLRSSEDTRLPREEPVRLVLRSASGVSGTVVGPDGKPLGGLMVYATDDLEKRQPRWAALSDSEGRFALKVPPGVPLVVHLPTTQSGDGREPYRGEISDVVAPAEGLLLRASKLRTDVSLTVELQDENGAAVDEGTVMAMAPPQFPHAIVDASGRVTLQGLPEEAIDVMVQRPAAPKHRVWSEAVPPATTRVVPGGAVVVLRFRKGVPLRGRVVDEQGNPVAGGSVVAQTQDYASTWVPTEADGSFSVLVLPGERIRHLAAEKRFADGKILRVEHKEFDPAAGEVILKVAPYKE